MEQTATPEFRRQRINGTGLETILDFVSVFGLILGALASVLALISLDWPGLAMSGMIASGAFLNWLFLRSIAELIRLQKRIAGLEYSGRISGSYFDSVPTCSNCGSMLHTDVACDGCGARLLKLDGEEPGQEEPGQDGGEP